jgi:hypothetical protein
LSDNEHEIELKLKKNNLSKTLGDIIHLIGYYPQLTRPTATTTKLPPFHNPNKPYYHYPSSQNDWMNNYIPGSSYPTHFNSPVSSPTSSSSHNHYNDYHNGHHHNSYGGSNGGGFMDEMGYAVTPSPVIINNDFNRPPSSPPRPSSNGYNDYQDDGNGYGYGSYQGKEEKHPRLSNCTAHKTSRSSQLEIFHSFITIIIFCTFFLLWLELTS